MSLIKVAHTRKAAIEYRPLAQHRLKLKDDLFDLLYSAYLWNEALIEAVYQRTVDKASQALSNELSTVIDRFVGAIDCVVNVNIIHAATDLSDPDRYLLVSNAIKTLSKLEYVTVEFAVESDASYWTLLQQLAALIDSKCPHGYSATAKGPTERIGEALSVLSASSSSDAPLPLVLVIPLAERVPSSILSALCADLGAICAHVTIVCVTDRLSGGLVEKDVQLRGLATLTQVSLPQPLDLWEPMYQSLIVQGKLALHLSPSLLYKLWNDFKDGVACCATVVQRLLLIVRLHLRKRVGLLVMVEEIPWMQSMKKVFDPKTSKDFRKGDESSQLLAIENLLSVLNSTELLGSAFSCSNVPVGSSSESRLRHEVEHVVNVLSDFRQQRQAAVGMLQVLQQLVQRAVALPERGRFHMCVIWPALWDPSKRVDFCATLQSSVRKQLPLLKAHDVLVLTKSMCELLQHHADTITEERWGAFWKRSSKQLKKVEQGLAKLSRQLHKFDVNDEWKQWSFRQMERGIANGDPSGSWNQPIEVLLPDRTPLATSDLSASPGTVSVKLDGMYIYHQLLEDFSACVVVMCRDFGSRFVSTEGLEGLIVVAQDCAHEVFHAHLNSSLRSRCVDGLHHPKHVIDDDGDAVPDVCYVGRMASQAKHIEVASGWYDKFESHVMESGNKKRRRLSSTAEVVDDEEQQRTTTRMRFANCLYDIEKAGLITVRANAKKVNIIGRLLYAGMQMGAEGHQS